MENIDLFSDTLSEIANGPHVGSHAAVTEALMRRLSEKGLPLARLTGRRMMDRSLRTLEARAREFGLSFPDYVPMAMRKRLAFIQRGDFFELRGEHVEAVADRLGIVVTGKGDDRMCAFPVHSQEECRKALEANWFIVKFVRARKPRKAATHG